MAKDKKIFTEDLAAALRTPFESGNVGPITNTYEKKRSEKQRRKGKV